MVRLDSGMGGGGVTISSNLESFAGRRVVDFAPDNAAAVGDPAALAWRLRLESYGDDRRSFDELFDQFLETVAADRVEALVMGTWAAEMYDVSAEAVVRRLSADAARLPRLRSLFLGDITFEEFEISWIRQTDVTPLLLAFPRLERLRVRGADGLALRPVRHEQLLELAFETGGLPAEVARAVGGCDLPRLEHLELWLGTPDYGGDAGVGDLTEILAGARFPRLRYLGLCNAEIADQVAAALATAPVVAQLEVLDLSMGVLTDQGATALLTGQPLSQLRRLDLHHHYLSNELAGRLRQQLTAAGVEVDLSEQEDAGEDDEDRYVAVGE
jgi:hypothetical protein